MGEDSKRRAVAKGCDQHDQGRPICRSELTKGAGAACRLHKGPEELSEKQQHTVTIKSKFVHGLDRTYAAAGLAKSS